MKKKILIGILAIVAISLMNLCWYTFAGSHKSVEKLAAGEELSLYECCSIYQLHLTMSICGFPISPEASRECLKLHFHQPDTVYFRHSHFGRSYRLYDAIVKLEKMPYGSSIKVRWDGNVFYSPLNPEHRAAIAVNPCTVTKVMYLDYQHFPDDILYTITTSTQYPKISRTEFDFRWFKLVINEGLFRYLQDKGWLSKYTAVYKLYL